MIDGCVPWYHRGAIMVYSAGNSSLPLRSSTVTAVEQDRPQARSMIEYRGYLAGSPLATIRFAIAKEVISNVLRLEDFATVIASKDAIGNRFLQYVDCRFLIYVTSALLDLLPPIVSTIENKKLGASHRISKK